jgi:hypothetical protein
MRLPVIHPPGTPTDPLPPSERRHKLLSAAFCLLCIVVVYSGIAIATMASMPEHGRPAHDILLKRTAFLDGPGCVSREKLRKTVYNEDGFAVAVKACEDMIDVSQVSIPRKP